MTGQRWGITQALAHIRRTIPDENAAFFALRATLRRGEIEASAETWGPSERWRARLENKGQLSPIPKEVWEHAQMEKNITGDTISWPKCWPYPGKIVEPDEDQYGHGVHVSRDDIERLWPAPITAGATSEASSQSNAGQGGRHRKWDWDGAFIEMARVAVHGDDCDRPIIDKAVKDWFVTECGSHPADSQIRDKVKRFHEALWPPKT